MSEKTKSFNCFTEKEDSILLDARGGILSVDIFNKDYDNEEEINTAVILTKKQAEELVFFLQSNIKELDDE